MRNLRKSGFTLVEILIVVVILGILAAIVVPQFTNASNEAIKGALQTQLQTINSQVELYRVREQGDYPDFAANGWDDLVNSEYLKEVPLNGYTGTSDISAGDATVAAGMDRDSADGWTYQDDDTAIDFYTVYAAGLEMNAEGQARLFHEPAFPVAGP